MLLVLGNDFKIFGATKAGINIYRLCFCHNPLCRHSFLPYKKFKFSRNVFFFAVVEEREMGFRKLHLFFLPTFSFVSEEVKGTLKNVHNMY